jgi:hypothetical protein
MLCWSARAKAEHVKTLVEAHPAEHAEIRRRRQMGRAGCRWRDINDNVLSFAKTVLFQLRRKRTARRMRARAKRLTI